MHSRLLISMIKEKYDGKNISDENVINSIHNDIYNVFLECKDELSAKIYLWLYEGKNLSQISRENNLSIYVVYRIGKYVKNIINSLVNSGIYLPNFYRFEEKKHVYSDDVKAKKREKLLKKIEEAKQENVVENNVVAAKNLVYKKLMEYKGFNFNDEKVIDEINELIRKYFYYSYDSKKADLLWTIYNGKMAGKTITRLAEEKSTSASMVVTCTNTVRRFIFSLEQEGIVLPFWSNFEFKTYRHSQKRMENRKKRIAMQEEKEKIEEDMKIKEKERKIKSNTSLKYNFISKIVKYKNTCLDKKTVTEINKMICKYFSLLKNGEQLVEVYKEGYKGKSLEVISNKLNVSIDCVKDNFEVISNMIDELKKEGIILPNFKNFDKKKNLK